MRNQALNSFLVASAVALVAACSSSTAPSAGAAVTSVAPLGGATGVSTSGSITMMFSDTMMAGMEAYMSLHRDSLRGPVVAMTAHWSSDHRTLTMTPNASLAPGTMYYIHMGGGMKDISGTSINYGACPGMGGQSATSTMMGGMMGGMSGEMSGDWMGTDGNYGMVFGFTTA